MWATKRIYRSLRQKLQLKQDGLHNSLYRAKSFEKSDQCYVLQAFHLLSTCSVSIHSYLYLHVSSHNTWFITDMKTNLNVTEGNKVNKKSSKSLDGGRYLEMEANMKHLNLSFAASGFLGIYHLGAASALCRHDTRKLYFGALTPGYDLMTKLRGYIDSILPPNAHEIAENRLFISVTSTKNGKNYLLSHFASREDLVKALLASSFIPLYAGINAVDYKGQKWIDGGLTNGLPILPKGRTVTVSPFCGRLDICPENRGRMDIYAKVAKQDIMLSIGNLIRLHQALFPPSQEKMELLYQDGYDDTIQFLLKENWFE
ncbi:hypothetical protein E2320_004625 [Naja naja]|nr:hypothetical protein E2320_004625 [Naja naja]